MPFVRKRAGEHVRQNAITKAYKPVVSAAMRQYDGHNGKTAQVLQARLDVTAPLLKQDGAHNTFIRELANPLPSFDKDASNE